MNQELNYFDIEERIKQLTVKNDLDKHQMLLAFNDALHELEPFNLLKNSVSDLFSSPGLGSTVLNTGLGLAVGYGSKKLAIGNSQNPFKLFLGYLIEVGMTSLVSKSVESHQLNENDEQVDH
jgi:hypothetical protein